MVALVDGWLSMSSDGRAEAAFKYLNDVGLVRSWRDHGSAQLAEAVAHPDVPRFHRIALSIRLDEADALARAGDHQVAGVLVVDAVSRMIATVDDPEWPTRLTAHLQGLVTPEARQGQLDAIMDGLAPRRSDIEMLVDLHVKPRELADVLAPIEFDEVRFENFAEAILDAMERGGFKDNALAMTAQHLHPHFLMDPSGDFIKVVAGQIQGAAKMLAPALGLGPRLNLSRNDGTPTAGKNDFTTDREHGLGQGR